MINIDQPLDLILTDILMPVMGSYASPLTDYGELRLSSLDRFNRIFTGWAGKDPLLRSFFPMIAGLIGSKAAASDKQPYHEYSCCNQFHQNFTLAPTVPTFISPTAGPDFLSRE